MIEKLNDEKSLSGEPASQDVAKQNLKSKNKNLPVETNPEIPDCIIVDSNSILI